MLQWCSFAYPNKYFLSQVSKKVQVDGTHFWIKVNIGVKRARTGEGDTNEPDMEEDRKSARRISMRHGRLAERMGRLTRCADTSIQKISSEGQLLEYALTTRQRGILTMQSGRLIRAVMWRQGWQLRKCLQILGRCSLVLGKCQRHSKTYIERFIQNFSRPVNISQIGRASCRERV